MKINIIDEDLFGNVMAQHEKIEVFKSYVYERPDFKDFWNPKYKIKILNAIKGTGKSTLCRVTEYKIQKNWPDNICLLKYDSDISPIIEKDDAAISTWVKEWKKSILHTIACELGAKVGFAWEDDATLLVEEARKGGYRKQSFLGHILDRISIKKLPLSTQIPTRTISDDFVKRVTSKTNQVWLIIDEIDQHFDNTIRQRNKLVSFFLACSELSQKIPQLIFRLTVRPNIWTIIATQSSGLSGLRQYIEPLSWTDNQIRNLLARRIRAYLIRTNQSGEIITTDCIRTNEEWLISQVFTGVFDLGQGSRPPHVVLSTLTAQRPRWLIELCIESAKQASNEGKATIDYKSTESSMEKFGFNRMQDLAAEYSEQCHELLEIMRSFTGNYTVFKKTHNFLNFINENILKLLNINISGSKSVLQAVDVANLLYSIHFIQARIDVRSGEYKHVYFEDRPDLLLNEKQAKSDDLFSWEIHPMFRNALFLRQGAKIGTMEDKPLSKKNRKKNRTKRSRRTH